MEIRMMETGTAEGSKRRRAAGTCLLCLRVAAGRRNSSQRKMTARDGERARESQRQPETARDSQRKRRTGRARQRRSRKKTLTSTLDPVWQRMAASQLASAKGPAKSQPLHDCDYNHRLIGHRLINFYSVRLHSPSVRSSPGDPVSPAKSNARQAPSRDPAAAASDAADWLGRAASGDIKEVIDQGSSSRANQPGRRRKMRKTQASITQACSVAMPWS
ncbi:hypothetical protein TEQG_08422 [Trichophyton equinum CBS 127.97]|uniref:Uncharacterized protein n=1 Tax=Trichophyton equinum (strain ATCC MYA-4606 / CBS 127.97) TaxID=559882 RepID=F2Q5Q9_TRIEC|nr:hypothetical protein TEQG_08422 [Trichophyton equinum CBS 127.97]